MGARLTGVRNGPFVVIIDDNYDGGMKVSEVLKRADRDGVWAFTPQTFSALCGGIERNYLKVMLKRLCDGGVLTRVAKGVYVNEDARCLPKDIRLAVVPLLRPREVSYVSLESRLSEAGVISQATTALTLMTTGSGHVFETPFGVLDFTHTARPATPETGVEYRPDDPIPHATVERAYDDLVRVGRNVGMVDQDELAEVIREERDERASHEP